MAPEATPIITIVENPAEFRAAAGQFLLFVVTAVARHAPIVFLGAEYSAAVSALVAAVLSSCAIATWRLAQQSLELETQRLMDTADAVSNPQGVFAAALTKVGHSLRLGGPVLPRITLTIEESMCLTVSLVQLALLFFFENWGSHGPQLCRVVAIAGHVCVALGFLFASHYWLPISRAPSSFRDKEAVAGASGNCNAFWFCLSLGHWVTTSWAAGTWWQFAASSAARRQMVRAALEAAPAVGLAEADAIDAVPQGSFFLFVPIGASVVMHAANIWSASRARQPLLLFLCVILSGISVTVLCVWRADVAVPWRAGIMPLFCVASAWIVWQEMVRSLSDTS
jgi:hypothetical protein